MHDVNETNTEQTDQPEEEKKQSLGSLLAGLGAAGMVYMLTRDKRSETIDTWKQDFLKNAREQNPELERIYTTRTGFMRRAVSKKARNDFSAQLKEQARIERFTDSLFERTGTNILRGEVSAPDIFTIHQNLAKLHPQESALISEDTIIQAQKTLAQKYSARIEQIEQKMSPKVLAEKKKTEHESALEHFFDEVNAQKPKLDPKKREQMLSVMKDALATGTIAIDPLRTDQFGEVVHEAYQKKVGIQTQLTAEELEHLYTFTERYREEVVLQEKTKNLFTKKSQLPTPIKARNAVFLGFQDEFFSKTMQEPGFAQLLDITKSEHETPQEFSTRLDTASQTLSQLRGFSYEVTSFHDNLFLQLNQTPGLNQARVANANYITDLLKKYPYLQKTIEGARIFQLQMKAAQRYEDAYKDALNDIPKQALPPIIASEDALTATSRFEALLRTGNLSEEEIQKRVHNYQKTAQQVMEERLINGAKTPLYETIFNRYAQQNPNVLPEEQIALTRPQGQMDQLSNRVFLLPEQTEEQKHGNTERKLIKQVLSQDQSISQLSLRSYMRSLFSWFRKAADKLFSGTLRTGSELLGRTFARPALSSAGSSAGRMASNQALKLAGKLAANIPIVRVVIIATVIIILVVFLMVGLDTKTMLAAQPYEMQQNAVLQASTTTPASVVTTIPTAQPETPYVSAPESLSQIVEFASEKTQTPVPLLLGISHIEASGTWNYSKDELAQYNTYGWWTTPDITVAQIKRGYGYDTCTGYIPADSVHGGEQAVKMNGTICVDYPDGTKSQVMGAMQFNILTWKGFADKIKQALSISREPDRRVLAEAFMGAGFFVKGRSGASSATSWTIMEIIKASAAYHTGGTKCSYAYGKHTGNYCREVCVIYNQYSQQYGAEPVDCSITLQY
ncbi:MAG: hypothetical protein NUV65_00260 [Candidatus Roizmanbacteria bacterium]|nr:hypothetical protein [Candidatus Roizmanbacteria bacterium]